MENFKKFTQAINALRLAKQSNPNDGPKLRKILSGLFEMTEAEFLKALNNMAAMELTKTIYKFVHIYIEEHTAETLGKDTVHLLEILKDGEQLVAGYKVKATAAENDATILKLARFFGVKPPELAQMYDFIDDAKSMRLAITSRICALNQELESLKPTNVAS